MCFSTVYYKSLPQTSNKFFFPLSVKDAVFCYYKDTENPMGTLLIGVYMCRYPLFIFTVSMFNLTDQDARFEEKRR